MTAKTTPVYKHKLPRVSKEEWEQCNQFNIDIVEEFLKQYHLSPRTLEQYKSALKIFFRWVSVSASNRPLYDLKARDALRYQNFLIECGMSSAAIRFKRAAVSSICNYLEVYYQDEYGSFKNIFTKAIPVPVKTIVNEKSPLTQDELSKLIRTLVANGKFQMAAYVRFSYSSGCRRAEAAQLQKEVVDYKMVSGKHYYMTHPIRCKGRGREGKVRRLVFDDFAMRAIRKWIQERGEDDCPYVFVRKTKDGVCTPLSPHTFNNWCEDTFTKIVGRRVHPHMFRSTRATHLVVDAKKDIRTAQALLGHESPETTNLYVIRNSDDDIEDVFD